MSDITDALTTKVAGKVPAWAVGIGLGVAVIAYRRWREKSSPPPSTMSDGTEAGEGATTPDDGSSPATSGGYTFPSQYTTMNPGGVIDYNGQPSGSVDTGPVNNDDWRLQAFDVVAAGGYSPVAVNEAIAGYLAGNPLTATQEAMVSIALRKLGPPPEGAPAIVRAPDKVYTPPNEWPIPAGPVRPSTPPTDGYGTPGPSGTYDVTIGGRVFHIPYTPAGTVDIHSPEYAAMEAAAAANGTVLGP